MIRSDTLKWKKRTSSSRTRSWKFKLTKSVMPSLMLKESLSLWEEKSISFSMTRASWLESVNSFKIKPRDLKISLIEVNLVSLKPRSRLRSIWIRHWLLMMTLNLNLISITPMKSKTWNLVTELTWSRSNLIWSKFMKPNLIIYNNARMNLSFVTTSLRSSSLIDRILMKIFLLNSEECRRRLTRRSVT